MPRRPWKKPRRLLVLFGSMARGDWSGGSDYDLLIGLTYDDGKRFIDRLEDFSPQEGNIEVFPYSLSEWQQMFAEYHTLFLEALAHGIVLWDRGAFSRMRKTFEEWLQSGKVTPWRNRWKIQDTR